jgi:hypothetical protein
MTGDDASLYTMLAHGGDGAKLELLDVGGRRIASRDVGPLGAGRHVVEWAAERRLPPGRYVLRLTQGANTRTMPVTVIE